MRKETTLCSETLQSTKSDAKGNTLTITDNRGNSPNPEFSLEG